MGVYFPPFVLGEVYMKQLDCIQTTWTWELPCFRLIRQIDGKEKMVAEIEAMLQSTRAARHGCASGGQK